MAWYLHEQIRKATGQSDVQRSYQGKHMDHPGSMCRAIGWESHKVESKPLWKRRK